MLKSKVLKAGFVGQGFLVFMIAPFERSVATDLFQVPAVYQSNQTNSKDTIGYGSIEFCQEETSDEPVAPKIELNKQAALAVKQFISRNREDLEAIEKRTEKYFSIIEPVFKQYNIPLELKYLAVVESQLKTCATSHVGAKGLWQFMPATAKELGLKINGKYDERTHAYKSTVAAAKYLRSLHKQFDDWLLVVAAYNSGPGFVYAAIKKSGSRNFWKLQHFLPAETRSHVKRFIGTHCYFQEDHSLTILTKQETLDYERSVAKFQLKQMIVKDEEAVVIRNSDIAVDAVK
jgi:membrane-bound lytic murein transglycosylase D